MDYRLIEEISLNHWPSLSTVLYDGWVLRFADGYTKRANCVNPIYASTLDVREKIRECENLYAAHRLPAVFKITPFVQPAHLDETLADMGYIREDAISLQLADLERIREPRPASAVVEEDVTSRWLDSYCRFENVDDNDRTILERLLANIAAKKGFVTFRHDDRIVACGLGVVDRAYMGIFCIVTDIHYRNRGFGEQMLLRLLQWGKANGARYGYLQVHTKNEPALRLYAKLGFSEIYRYWYRIKQDK